MLKGLTPLAFKFVVGLVLALLFVGILTVQSCNSAKTAKTEARLSENQSEAALASGADAVETLGDQSGREDQTDALTRSNSDAIRKAPGAGDAVNPDLDALARERLCRYTVYLKHPDCVFDATAD